jgi:hypothetical protein
MKFDIWGFFENLSRKLRFHLNRTRVNGTLHEDQYTFFIISRSVLLIVKNVSYRSRGETRKTRFMFNTYFFQIVQFEVTCNNIAERGRPQMTIWRVHMHAAYLRLQIHRLTLRTTYLFSSATMVTRTRLDVKVHLHCLPCYCCIIISCSHRSR